MIELLSLYLMTACGWAVLTCSTNFVTCFRGPIGDVWNSSLQMEHLVTLMSSSEGRSRNASITTYLYCHRSRPFSYDISENVVTSLHQVRGSRGAQRDKATGNRSFDPQ
jgi:hypothetical protein